MVFVETRKKLTHGFFKFFEKYANIMFFCNLLKNFLKIFENFLKIPKKLSFSASAQKIIAWFAKYFEKYAKIMHFKKIFENFSKFHILK